jgi:hypothetical protein
MIAQRFRSVGWVAGVAVAATLLYIISLQVATERGRLESVDRKIASTKRDIRQLQTEMGTRASLRQLERWNGEVLSLSTPGANQFLPSEDSISSIDHGNLGTSGAAPPPVMAAVLAPEAPVPQTAGATANGLTVKAQTNPVTPALSAQDRQVQTALTAPKRIKVEAVAAAEAKPKVTRSLDTVMKTARIDATPESKRKP